MLSLTRRKTWHRQSTTMYQAQNHKTKYTEREMYRSGQRSKATKWRNSFLYSISNNKSKWRLDDAIFFPFISLSLRSFSEHVCVCVEQIIMPFTTNVPKCSRKPIHQHFDDDQQTASLKRLWTLRIAHTNENLSLDKTYRQSLIFSKSHREQQSWCSRRIIRGNI